MSYYSTTAVTVDKEKSDELVAWIWKNGYVPDTAVRHEDGSCTFVWGWRNHFDSEGLLERELCSLGHAHFSMATVDESMLDIDVDRSGEYRDEGFDIDVESIFHVYPGEAIQFVEESE